MKIAILVTMTNNFGKKGFYNSQEIGLARAFGKLGHTVKIYKSVRSITEQGQEKLGESVTIHYIHSRYIGANGFIPMNKIDNTVNALIQFADTQLSVPTVYRWCLKRKIKYIPYIGVTWSQSNNPLVRKFINLRFKKNLKVFQNSTCFVKNQYVQKKLSDLCVNKIELAPVGLDIDQLLQNYSQHNPKLLKKKWGLGGDDRIILFIGRLEPDKRPLDLIRIFRHINQNDKHTRLLIVGKGILKEEAQTYVKENNLVDCVKFIDEVENHSIWELYRISSVLVNMNKSEIFGMVLLEAMYYECGIVAYKAPGPEMIIVDKETGFIATSDQDIENYLREEIPPDIRLNAHSRVINVFSWKNTASLMLKSIVQ